MTKGDINGVVHIGKLSIGFNSMGDDLEGVCGNDNFMSQDNAIHILNNTCRTKGITLRNLEVNNNRA